MSIHRVGRAHFERFVSGDKNFVENPTISAKAKLFLMWMTSHSESYRIHVATMCKLFKEGKSAIYEGLKELAAHGYMCKYQPRINGRMGATHYLVSVEPLTPEQWQEEIQGIDWYHLEGAERLEPTASRKSESGGIVDDDTAYRFSASGNSASGRSDTKTINTKTTNDKTINYDDDSSNITDTREGVVEIAAVPDPDRPSAGEVAEFFELFGVIDYDRQAVAFMDHNDFLGWTASGQAVTSTNWRPIAKRWLQKLKPSRKASIS